MVGRVNVWDYAIDSWCVRLNKLAVTANKRLQIAGADAAKGTAPEIISEADGRFQSPARRRRSVRGIWAHRVPARDECISKTNEAMWANRVRRAFYLVGSAQQVFGRATWCLPHAECKQLGVDPKWKVTAGIYSSLPTAAKKRSSK